MRRLLLACAASTALAACAASHREKGGLVAHPELSGASAVRAKERRLALLIGVPDPDDAAWPELRYAGKDAADLGGALADPRAGRFEAEILKEPAQTTRAAIKAAIERLNARNRSPDDVVVVYFSGHGTLARPSVGPLHRYLVTSDTRRSAVPATGLDVDELRTLFEALRSRRKLLVIAACHSGSGKSLLPEEVERELRGLKGAAPRPLAEVSRATTTLSAASWGEAAREDDRLRNDVYTHFLLEAIVERRDRNRDGAVSAEEAHDHARQRTYAYTHGAQTPTAESVVTGIDPIVLAGEIERSGLPEIGSYDPSFDGAELLVDGSASGTLPGSFAVPPGKHRLVLLKGESTLAEAAVDLSSGDRLDLAELAAGGQGRVFFDARAGIHSLLSGSMRRTIGGPLPLGSLSLTLPALLLRRIDLALDVSAGGAATRIAPAGVPIPVVLTLYEAGAELLYPVSFGRARFAVGPRLSVSLLRRSADVAARRSVEHALLTVPGASAELRVRLFGSVDWVLGARLSYSALSVDGATTHLGAVAAETGLGWRLQ